MQGPRGYGPTGPPGGTGEPRRPAGPTHEERLADQTRHAVDEMLAQQRAPARDRVISGYSGHVPGLRAENVNGCCFLTSVSSAEEHRPRLGSDLLRARGEAVAETGQNVRMLPKSASVPGFGRSGGAVGDVGPMVPSSADKSMIVGFGGHIPGSHARSWRWVGKTFSNALGAETCENFAKREQIDRVVGWDGPANRGSSDANVKEKVGYSNPGVVGGYSGHIQQGKSELTSGCSFQQGMAKLKDSKSQPELGLARVRYSGDCRPVGLSQSQSQVAPVRYTPIAGYSGHVHGLVARNIVGRSYADTIQQARVT